MRKILYIIGMTLAMNLASCQKNGLVVNSPNENAVTFSAESIASPTKVNGTNWEANDVIGISAVTSEGAIYKNNFNVKYLALESGATTSFTPASDDIIYYSADGIKLNFQAFYPYKEEWTNGNMILDLSTQDGTEEVQKKLDILYSDNCSNQTAGEQKLQFKHLMTKVKITVSNCNDENSAFENLDELTANSFMTRYWKFDANKKVICYEYYEQMPIEKGLKMVRTSDGNNAIFTLIIAPNNKDFNGEIEFTDGVRTYVTTLKIESPQQGKQYNFTTTVGSRETNYVNLSLNGITSWDTQADVNASKDIEIDGNNCKIYSVLGLKFFAERVESGENSMNGKLMNNIELSDEWTPIFANGNNDDKNYSGTFDGGGYSITGLKITASEQGQGLFGACKNATIKNLKVGGEVSSNYSNTAIIVGKAWNTVFEKCETLEGSSVKSTSEDSSLECFAGIVGSADNCSFSLCDNRANIDGQGVVGGIAASISGTTTIFRCNNYAAINAAFYAGGIIGVCNENVVDKDSYNRVINSCSNYGVIKAESCVGGIVAECRYSFIINCANKANIETQTGNVGGLVYLIFGGYIYNSYNQGYIICTASSNNISDVGGLVGSLSSATIRCCYTSTSPDLYGSSSIGVAVGYISSNYSFYVYYCYGQSDGKTTFLFGDDKDASDHNSMVCNDEYMKDTNKMLDNLNYAVSNYNINAEIKACSWEKTSFGYPTLIIE